MQIYVCIKHVPDTAASIGIVGENGYDDKTPKFIVNPYDEYALEEALRIRQREGGEVVVVTVGKEAAIGSIRTCLAVGADRAILVKTDAQFLDSSLTSMAIKKAIEQDGKPDLILTGKQSIDTEGMQTQFRLAAAFHMPVANDVVHLQIEGNRAVAETELGAGTRRVLEMALPCVVGAGRGLNEPHYPTLPQILKAKSKPIRQIELAELGVEASSAEREVLLLEPAPGRPGAKILEGSVRERIEELVRILQEEKVL